MGMLLCGGEINPSCRTKYSIIFKKLHLYVDRMYLMCKTVCVTGRIGYIAS